MAWATVASASLLLGSCGGGGGGGNDDRGDAPPTVAISNAERAEGDAGTSSLVFAVTLSGPSDLTVTVNYSTVAGSAQAGVDFVATSGTLTFTPGQTSRSVTVTVNGDTDVEPDETLSVTLSDPVNATLANATATGVILNDDVETGPQFGLDTRPSNPTCLAPERPVITTTVTTADAYPAAARFFEPTKILQPPGDGSKWFVLEKSGRIKVLGTTSPYPLITWLNLTDRVDTVGEGGLLGMAFHPDWPSTREIYLSYTSTGSPLTTRISRIIVDDVTLPASFTEQILLTVDQPSPNHNNGEIGFGPDGHLYIGMGDGGDSNDPRRTAQDNSSLLGKILRIKVAGVAWPAPGYEIPTDNPHAGNAKCGPGSNAANCPEIYAFGFRNPWRWSFDEPTGQLWVGDVGQSAREEVNVVELGGNYGWSCREGLIAGPNSCSSGGAIDPVSEYSHDGSYRSITGGFVYRGNLIPSLFGRYVFGDYGTGQIWALKDNGQGGYTNEELINTSYGISTFGLGNDDELYFADWSNGRIRRLEEFSSVSSDTIPTDLADTGCMSASQPTEPAAGLIPYVVNSELWSDDATKDRYIALPDGQHIEHTPAGDFDFPSGSVLVKSFSLGGQPIETRLFMRHPDGVWAGYTYEWNDTGTMATRVIGGKARQVGGQTWHYPSEDQCMQCHTAVAGFTLGPTIAQLNGSFTYPTTNRNANQLATLEHISVFSEPLPGPPDTLPVLPNPEDTTASVGERARAYLDANCSQCHQPGGPTLSTMDLRATTSLAATGTCNVPPQAGNLGITNARIIAPGDASRSVLVARANRRDANGMPPIASTVIDASGVALLTAWVDSLGSCP